MPFGPLQLVVVALPEAVVPQEVANQLNDLRERAVVRLVDVAFIAKDDQGNLTEIRTRNHRTGDEELPGILSGAFFGFGAGSRAVLEVGLISGFLSAEHGEFGITPSNVDEVADMIPRKSSVVVLLIEHLWATDLKESVQAAQGSVLAHGWVTPSALIEMGDESAS